MCCHRRLLLKHNPLPNYKRNVKVVVTRISTAVSLYRRIPRPQAAAQIFFLSGLDKGIEPSALMIGSITGCILSIGYLVATTELDLDTSRSSRTNYGSVHGYFPTNSLVMQTVVVAGIVLFIAGYLVAKLLALVILASGSSILTVAGWCCAEALTLLVMRYFVEGSKWKFHIASLSGLVPSLLLHAIFYIGMLAAPFPFLRYLVHGHVL